MNDVDHFLRTRLLHDRCTMSVNVGGDYVKKLLHLIFKNLLLLP